MTFSAVSNFIFKNRITILIILLIITSILSIRGCIKNKTNYINTINAITNKDQTIKYWKEKDSVDHAVVNQTLATKEAIIALYKNQLSDLAKQLDVKSKQITDYINIIEETKGNITAKVDTLWRDSLVVIKGKDSIIHQPIYIGGRYKDKWLTFNTLISNNKLITDYSINDSLNIIGYWKRTGFLGLGRRNYYLDISSLNPNAHIQNTSNFSITNSSFADRKYGIGILGGYGISANQNHIQMAPFIGIGVYYKLF